MNLDFARIRRRLPWLALCLALAVLLPASIHAVPASPALARNPAAPEDTPTQFASGVLSGMTVTPTSVYWHTNCGGDFFPTRSFLRRKPVAAGAEETRYAPRDCAAGAVASANVAVDNTHVYWIEANGRIMRQAVGATTTTRFAQTVRTQVGGYPGCCWIAVDNTNVYWSEGDTIFRKAKSGGDSNLIYTEPFGPIFDLRAGGDGSLYYRVATRLQVLRFTTGAYVATTVAVAVAAYTLGPNRVFWADVGTIYQINSLRRSDLGDYDVHYVSNDAGRPRVVTMTTDGTNLYWHDRFGATAGGPIWRRPIASTTPAVQLTPYLDDVNLLQTAGGNLYWTGYLNGIWRMATGASVVPAPTGDLEITGLHITQGIQVDNNRIPLVGDKTTIVRVFARGVADENGPWTDVIARMQVTGDTTLYESRPIAVRPGGSDANTLADSFTFVLARASTRLGGRMARVTISSFSGRPEANSANNTITRTLNFRPAQRITFYGFTYGNTNTTCTGDYAPDDVITPYPNFVEHRRFMENLFPVALVSIVPMPGNPQRLFDNSGDCTAYLTAHNYINRHMAMQFPDGGQRAYVLTPEGGGYFGWCCSAVSGNQVARGQDLRSDPGPTLAHEIAHSYGRPHTFEDSNYPRPAPPLGGPMGPYVGFRLFSNEAAPRPQVIRGQTDATTFMSDIMSYVHPQWISPYTYCLLSRTISNEAVVCPAGLDGIPAAAAESGEPPLPERVNAATYLYVGGYLDAQDDIVLEPFEQLELDGNPVGPAGKAYSLTLETLIGGPLPDGVFTFDIDPLPTENEENPQPETQRRFGFYIPWNPSTEAIRIYSQGSPVAERLVTANPPAFTSFDFSPGSQVTGVQTLEWVAGDADGDSLTFSVWYSPNNGQQWLPVDVLQQKSSTAVNFDALPGSQQALVRVLATDGVNTTTETSASFAVPLHAPIVAAAASLDPDGYLAVATSTVYDYEEGAIEDPNAYLWTSDWQGEVGRGPWLSASALQPGSHHLTLAVTDGDGETASTGLDVLVPAQPDLVAASIQPGLAGVLTWQGSHEITLSYPQDFADAPLRLLVGSVISRTLPDPPGVLGESFQIIAQDAGGGPHTAPFAAPLTLSAAYSTGVQLDGMDESRLAFFFLNEGAGSWEMIPSTVDTNENRVVAQIDHLTRFALVARLPDTTVLDAMFLPAAGRE